MSDSANAEIMELLERRLADRVSDRVERTLKVRYGAVVAAALFVMGLTGYSIVNNLVRELVGGTVTPVTKEAERSIAQMQVQLDLARETKKRLDVLVEQIGTDADAAQRRIESFQVRLGKTQEEFQTILESLQDQLSAVTVRRRELEADLAANSQGLAAAVGQNRGELAQLAEQVAALAGAAAGGGDPTRVAADAQALAERVRAAASREVRATVFLQYGGGATAELVTGLTAKLREGGYIVPVAEALPTDAHEVRYFHAPDRDAAAALAKDTMEALKALGGPPVLVEVRDFTTYPKAKPRAGTVELWLGLPEQAG